jgi:hypothetical protein
MTTFLATLACLLPVAHPISVTRADVYVTRTGATMRLKMFAEDIDRFLDLERDEFGIITPEEMRRGIDEYKEFLIERVIMRDANGEPISGEVVNIKPFEIPEDGVDVAELMNYSLTYQFEFKFDDPPKFLTFEQNITDINQITPSEMTLTLKQAGGEGAYEANKIIPGTPHTPPPLDWTHPPLSPDASATEWDEWTERQHQQNLGISSYSSTYSFIYITDYEVRHEILVPLATLASIFHIDRKDQSWLELDEQDAARAAIQKYFGEGNPVHIDGVEVQPVFDRIAFHSLDLRDFAMNAPDKRISMANGRVGIIMSYSTKGTPNHVKVKWTKYSPNMQKIHSVIIAFEEFDKFRFSRFANGRPYEWTNPGREPRPEISTIAASLPPKPELTVRPMAYGGLGIGLLCFLAGLKKFGWKAAVLLLAGAGTAAATWSQTKTIDSPFEEPKSLSEDEAQTVFETLHRNVYRAFDYGTEDEVYDALAASVSGNLLKDVYLNIRKSLEVREQGGAMARISEVRYGSVAPKEVTVESEDGESRTRTVSEFIPAPGTIVPDEELPWPAFRYRSNWTVSGSIEHWGHIHERANQFDGIFTVQLEDGAWKITDFEIVDEKRIKAETRARKF